MASCFFRLSLPSCIKDNGVLSKSELHSVLDYYLKHYMFDWFGGVGIDNGMFAYEYRLNYRSPDECCFRFYSEFQLL